MGEEHLCGLCGEPMPAGEEMFRYHGYSCPCPKPPLEEKSINRLKKEFQKIYYLENDFDAVWQFIEQNFVSKEIHHKMIEAQENNFFKTASKHSEQLTQVRKEGLQRAAEICSDAIKTLPSPSERVSFYVKVIQQLKQELEKSNNEY